MSDYQTFLDSYTEAEKNGATKTALRKMERDYFAAKNAARRAEAEQSFRLAVAAQDDLLMPLAPRLAEIWRSLDDGRFHQRKPSIGLRLPAVGAVGRVVVCPGFDRNLGQVMRNVNLAELLVDRDSDERSFLALRLRFTAQAVFRRRYFRDRVLADVPIVADTIRAFLDDPAGYVGLLNPDRCVLCGRPLVDPLSLARGIGPECAKGLPFFRGVFKTLAEHEKGGCNE